MAYKALLICNSTYPRDPAHLAELKGPRVDGMWLWRALTDPTRGLFAPSDVSVLMERTSQEIMEECEKFFRAARSDDTVLLYYSGHGRRDGQELVLCGRETITSRLEATGISASRIDKVLKRSHASAKVVILDCCHSGAFKGQDLVNELRGTGRFVLAAAKSHELAPDAESDGEPSPFTAHLVQAIAGEAARGGENVIDLDGVRRFVETATAAGGGSSPQHSFGGAGSLVIAKVAPDQTHDAELPMARYAPVQAETRETKATNRIPDPSAIGMRVRGDLTFGDRRLWALCAIAAFGAAVSAFITMLETVDRQYLSDKVVFTVSMLAMAIAPVLIAVCLTEAVLTARRKTSSALRLDGVRRARMLLCFFCGTALVPPIFYLGTASPAWTLEVTLLVALAAVAGFEVSGRGAAGLGAGALLLTSSALTPVSFAKGVTLFFSTAPGAITFFAGLGALAVWTFQASPRWLLSLVVPVIFLIPAIYDSDLVIGPYVAAAGVLVIVASLMLGSARPLPANTANRPDDHDRFLARSMGRRL